MIDPIRVPLTLNLDRRYKDTLLKASQGDNSVWDLEITIKKGEIVVLVETMSARIVCKKPDGTMVYDDCTLSEGKVIARVGGGMFEAPGNADCYIELSNETQVLNTSHFIIYVDESFEADIQSTDHLIAMEVSVRKCAQKAQEATEQALESKNQADRSFSEADRAKAEANRAKDEADRSEGFANGLSLILVPFINQDGSVTLKYTY